MSNAWHVSCTNVIYHSLALICLLLHADMISLIYCNVVNRIEKSSANITYNQNKFMMKLLEMPRLLASKNVVAFICAKYDFNHWSYFPLMHINFIITRIPWWCCWSNAYMMSKLPNFLTLNLILMHIDTIIKKTHQSLYFHGRLRSISMVLVAPSGGLGEFKPSSLVGLITWPWGFIRGLSSFPVSRQCSSQQQELF